MQTSRNGKIDLQFHPTESDIPHKMAGLLRGIKKGTMMGLHDPPNIPTWIHPLFSPQTSPLSKTFDFETTLFESGETFL